MPHFRLEAPNHFLKLLSDSFERINMTRNAKSGFDLHLECGGNRWNIQSGRATSLSITQTFDPKQPNHFGAPLAESAAWETDGFIGDTHRGGSCNVQLLSLVPHCNGTHTETVSHIIDEMVPIGDCLLDGPVIARLITVDAAPFSKTGEGYHPIPNPDDLVISAAAIQAAIDRLPAENELGPVTALIIRTRPNDDSKKNRVYSFDNPPPFPTHDAMKLIVGLGVQHLLVDLPSVDRMSDGGRMGNHCVFWNVDPETRETRNRGFFSHTISEMVFVPDQVADGTGLLDIQIAALASDAAPSRPVWFPLENA
jgi:kynurenine formamidase